MIKTKEDYLRYRKQDGTLNLSYYTWFRNDVLRYQILLRRAEYRTNTAIRPLAKLYAAYLRYRLNRFGRKLGFTIGVNVFGPGLSIAHRGTIVVNNGTIVGENCRLHVCVNIGTALGSQQAPVIGDNVYIGPGAKIFGAISIADGVAIAANAVVNKTCDDSGVTLGGVPARKISDGGSCGAGWNP